MKYALIERDETLHCENGAYRMGRRLLHDHHPYGELSLTDVLVKSSNIGMAKIGERLTNPKLFEAVNAFGFGQPTGIELPGEVAGLVRPLEDWDEYSTGSIPMGHELAVTPLQLIAAHAALANGGNLMRPHLVQRHTDAVLPEGNASPPVRSRSVGRLARDFPGHRPLADRKGRWWKSSSAAPVGGRSWRITPSSAKRAPRKSSTPKPAAIPRTAMCAPSFAEHPPTIPNFLC